jgi:FkbM family methyltransferase
MEAIGCRHLDYFSFWERSGLDLLPVTFWADFRADFEANEARYRAIFDRLADAESRATFRDILSFRLTADLRRMSGYTDRQREQYFEPFLELRQSGETFVDVGSYDGFTALQFMDRCPEYRRIMVFEPEAHNLEVVRERLDHHRDIRFYPYGLGAEPGTCRFSASGSASSISDTGECEIQIETLDRLAREPVSFVKMDIEGAEGGAIAGAVDTIRRDHPRLAVCVYHKAADLWRIPEQVLSIRGDYRLFLRHYTEGVTETVMFFVP